eukprot:jgi/Botrbrau1/16662/Bobra.0068s0078.1
MLVLFIQLHVCKCRQSSRTVAGGTQTYDLSACLQDTPNAHNLTVINLHTITM